MSGARKMAMPAAAPAPSMRSPIRTRSPDTTAWRLSFGIGEAAGSTGWAAASAPSASKAAISATRRTIHSSRVHVVVRLQHLIRGRDDLRIHLIGALRGDQVGHFDHRVDVRLLEIALLDRSEERRVGKE